jgi:indolepyruvate ferredoxin oxidoreductase, beta subunit
LIPAVGGQGGGVLSEWIVEAAALDGYRVHGTSIPGVAQRTGSTTYYVELLTDREAAEDPAFSLYPVPGALDVLLAPEYLEVARMIEAGFVSPARTTVVCSTHRLYTIHEKTATGGAIYPREQIDRLARAAARRLVAFDALALARERGTEVNAVLLGALAGSRALPVSAAAFRKAIESRGVAVAANLAGFDIGLDLARGDNSVNEGVWGKPEGSPNKNTEGVRGKPQVAPSAYEGVREKPQVAPSAYEGVRGKRYGSPDPIDWGKPDGSPNQTMPPAVRSIVDLALPRLVDYQDSRYARRYLARLRPFVGREAVGAIVARHLATWMTYEDAIRVAQAKTRASRFARIRGEAGAGNAVLEVTDYLKPDLDEMWGILPHGLVAPFARWAQRRWPHGRPTLGQHVRTTTVTGYLRVWLLARLRILRPISWRARVEDERIERWLAAVDRTLAWDEALALEVAHLARLVKGYGDVRRRLASLFDSGLALALQVGEAETGRGASAAVATALIERFRSDVLAGPDGELRAAALAAAAGARAAAGDVDGVRALVTPQSVAG